MIQVIQIKEDLFVYPIFKNGSSSLKQYAKRNKCKMLFNEQVRRCETITTYIREPKERFVAGVHSYIAFERRKDPNLDYDQVLEQIKTKGLTNEHFVQQFWWLNGLARYYSGKIKFENSRQLLNLIPDRKIPHLEFPEITPEQHEKIGEIEFNLAQDYKIWDNYMDKTINLKDLLNVLSKT